MTGLSSAVRDRLANTGGEATTGRVAAALRAEERLLGDREVLVLADELRAEFVGAGPLEPLLRSPDVTDVLVNGPDEVWIDTGSGLVRTAVRFPDEATLRRLAQRLTAAAGRRLDDASPYADARLPGGVRLHAVLPPVAATGTCLSLRLPRRRAFTLDELVTARTVPPEGADLLAALIESRAAFLISGGTGTGKTTLLINHHPYQCVGGVTEGKSLPGTAPYQSCDLGERGGRGTCGRPRCTSTTTTSPSAGPRRRRSGGGARAARPACWRGPRCPRRRSTCSARSATCER